jgi:hypothetical protein
MHSLTRCIDMLFRLYSWTFRRSCTIMFDLFSSRLAFTTFTFRSPHHQTCIAFRLVSFLHLSFCRIAAGFTHSCTSSLHFPFLTIHPLHSFHFPWRVHQKNKWIVITFFAANRVGFSAQRWIRKRCCTLLMSFTVLTTNTCGRVCQLEITHWRLWRALPSKDRKSDIEICQLSFGRRFVYKP